MKKSKVSFLQIVLYGIVVFVSNWLSKYPLEYFLLMINDLIGYNLFFITIGCIAYFLIPLGITWISFFLFLKIQQASAHYVSNVGKYYWIKSCISLVIPAEIFRFIITFFTLGQIKTTGFFALPPSFLFESTYLRWSGRSILVRHELSYIFLDFVAYTVCYLIYAAIHLFGIFMIYRYFWKIGKNEHEDMIVYESKRRFY